MSKLAVVLFNLGGPDRPDSVRPFLFNLFNDPAIIALPGPVRRALAWWISSRRAPVARKIYAEIGGGSPIVANTEAQAVALARVLADNSGEDEVRTFVVMRYWHPRSDTVAAEVASFGPDEIVLLPLYPQFSTTTTGSSLDDWRRAAEAAGLRAPMRAVCCYPREPGFIAAIAGRVRAGLEKARAHGTPRVLFSAHGLPERVIARGDPYAWQTEETAAAIADELHISDLDWRLCYQSRVGRMTWIGPATDAEIRRAGADGVPLVVVPIAFVSEHSETLVELDIEYRTLARDGGVPHYERVSTVDADASFIAGLATLVRRARDSVGPVCSLSGGRRCPARLGRCPLAANPA